MNIGRQAAGVQTREGGGKRKTHYTQTEALPEVAELERARREIAKLTAIVEEGERDRQNLSEQLTALAEEKRQLTKTEFYGKAGDDFLLMEYQNQVAAHEQDARIMRKEIAGLKEQTKYLRSAAEEAQRQAELLKQDLDRVEMEKTELTKKMHELNERRLMAASNYKAESGGVLLKKLSNQNDLSDFSSAPDDIHVQRANIKNRVRR